MPTLQFLDAEGDQPNAENHIVKRNMLEGLKLDGVSSLTTCGNRGVCGVATVDGKFLAYDMEDEEDDDDDDEEEEEDEDEEDNL